MKRWSQHRHELRLINEISITPLLDVVLVLLFVFMLAAPLLQNSAALRLPSAGSTSEPAPKDVVTLTVDASQTLSLSGKVLPHSDLRKELGLLQQERPGLGVLVQMHRDLPVQVLVNLMDTLRQAGIQRTAVATSSETR